MKVPYEERRRRRKDSAVDKRSSKKPKRKERDPKAPRLVPKTLESKRIFSPDQLMNESTLAEMDTSDEFSRFFIQGELPKILITTSRRAHPATYQFAEELADLFPTANYRQRPSTWLVSDVVKGAVERAYTHLLIVNESRKVTNSLSVIKLPEGPTALFQLSSIRLAKQIHHHGRSSSHTPELILNNLVTKLGHRVGRLFVSLFPHVPQFEGRQVVTFHNQRDFIFVRRHRYIFDENGQRVRMQEIGPQFTLKLHKILKATHDLQEAEVEYEWKPHAIDNKKFAL